MHVSGNGIFLLFEKSILGVKSLVCADFPFLAYFVRAVESYNTARPCRNLLEPVAYGNRPFIAAMRNQDNALDL